MLVATEYKATIISCRLESNIVAQKKNIEKLKENSNTFPWKDACSLLKSLGYKQEEKAGSRVRFYNEATKRMIRLHRPHPDKDLKGGALKALIEFLDNEGHLS